MTLPLLLNYIETLLSCDMKENNITYNASCFISVDIHLLCNNASVCLIRYFLLMLQTRRIWRHCAYNPWKCCFAWVFGVFKALVKSVWPLLSISGHESVSETLAKMLLKQRKFSGNFWSCCWVSLTIMCCYCFIEKQMFLTFSFLQKRFCIYTVWKHLKYSDSPHCWPVVTHLLMTARDRSQN